MASFTSKDELYMQRCLQLASKAIQNVAPNPMVGAVIVHNGKIIGEGYHMKFGEAHAEVNAVNDVKNQNLLAESTLYVNLEPCAHYGKTPPCSSLIIEKKITKVVVGCVDTFSKVAGKGIERMQKAGIEVVSGVLEKKSRELNKRFFTFHEKKRPYIILKWAESKDGFMDKERNINESAARITDETCRMMVHKMRAEESGIMVGTETARKDNPSLNVRDWTGSDPLRVVLDKDLRLSTDLNLFDGSQPTLIYTAKEAENKPNITYVNLDFKMDVIPQVLNDLHSRNILSLIVEGGAQVLQSFIDLKLWDEAWKFVGPDCFNTGVKGPTFSFNPADTAQIGNSTLFAYHNYLG